MEKNKQNLEKFMLKVRKDPPPGNCWYWLGGYTDTGYGRFCIGGAVWRAHVWIYSYFNGDIQPGSLVRHKCNHRWCVNPEHLTTGTKSDNERDKVRSGTCKKMKVTNEQVIQIRKRLLSGEKAEKLAEEFKLHPGTVWSFKDNSRRKALEPETSYQEPNFE